MRPNLSKAINLQDFRNYYWLKEELQLFCRENGMSASGSKQELSERIVTFISTGEVTKPMRKATKKKIVQVDLSLDTVIVENHRCSQEVRAFFKTIIPNFHFSTYIQSFFKNNVGKKYRNVVKAWDEEEERKKSPSYTKEIAPQFEYNQFIRDFFADPKNKEKSRKQAINAWNTIKKLPGSNKYVPTKG
ncbi:hypothetical protein SAMN05880501_1264 [Ureibacillus xyleni]|uniref:SAP domain-containing protein n=1 Tax=Ureibacillus xyleni TaxID=614648 RepID=A0A285TUE7_9BACL|nr:DUF6434 domain-containing protein [Ureibacillus xyleni]SOC27641.1 hypothetical protein SAMN05880501_1264 [Ureibacillus xyleni]